MLCPTSYRRNVGRRARGRERGRRHGVCSARLGTRAENVCCIPRPTQEMYLEAPEEEEHDVRFSSREMHLPGGERLLRVRIDARPPVCICIYWVYVCCRRIRLLRTREVERWLEDALRNDFSGHASRLYIEADSGGRGTPELQYLEKILTPCSTHIALPQN